MGKKLVGLEYIPGHRSSWHGGQFQAKCGCEAGESNTIQAGLCPWHKGQFLSRRIILGQVLSMAWWGHRQSVPPDQWHEGHYGVVTGKLGQSVAPASLIYGTSHYGCAQTRLVFLHGTGTIFDQGVVVRGEG